MDLNGSNAVKELYKRSSRVCLLYFIIFAGVGCPLLYYSVSQCLKQFATNFLISAIMSLGFVIAAGFFLKLLVTKNYGPHIQEYFAEHSESTIAELDKDFADAEHVVKSLWIGTKCTYHIGYLYPYILENKDLIWVYLTHVSGNGGSWKVNFCDKNKKMTCIALKSEKKAKRIVEIYNNNFKHIVMGFNKDLEKMYNEDLNGFLNLKYNQNI